MDMKSKKLVLLAMRINDAIDTLKLKITNIKIVNLEMFANVRIQNFKIDYILLLNSIVLCR